MQTVQNLLDPWRGRFLRGCGLALILGTSLGCGDDPTAPREAPGTLDSPSLEVVPEILQGLGLESLPGPIPTYFSTGSAERAESLQAWLRAADEFFQDRLKIAPPFGLAVLNEEDWAQISPGPYGVPFVRLFPEPGLVVMPALPERSVVTQIYSAARVGLPADAAAELEAVGVSYDEAVGQIVDLIGFHEVGHVYSAALGYHMRNNTPRWLNELLPTYAAYSYLDVAEPSSIVVWNALSEALLEFVPPVSRSLDDFNELGLRGLGPATYGWFQSHFNLRSDLVVRRRPRGTWFRQLSATGLNEDTGDLPTSELLRRLRGFQPSFTEWAENAGLEYH